MLFKEYLKSKGLEIFPILTTEDLIFPLGLITIDLFLLIFSGFVFSLLMEPIIYNKNFTEFFLSKIKRYIVNVNHSIIKIIFLSLAFTILLLLVYFTTEILNTSQEWVMFIAIFTIPLLLITLPKQKLVLTGLQFVFIFLWINLFVDSVVAKNKSNWCSDIVSFEYSGQHIITGKNDLNLVFYGYKNVVVQNVKSGKFLILPTDQIQNLEFKKK